MAYDTFMKIAGPDLKGESTATGYAGQMEVYSFSWGASQPVTIGSQSAGAGGGRVSISDMNIMKKVDSSSPLLFQACCKGSHFSTVTFQMRKAGAKQIVYLEYVLEEVYVSSYQISGSSGGDDTPSESLSLAFGKITYHYWPQTTAGGQGTVVPASWDLKTIVAE